MYICDTRYGNPEGYDEMHYLLVGYIYLCVFPHIMKIFNQAVMRRRPFNTPIAVYWKWGFIVSTVDIANHVIYGISVTIAISIYIFKNYTIQLYSPSLLFFFIILRDIIHRLYRIYDFTFK